MSIAEHVNLRERPGSTRVRVSRRTSASITDDFESVWPGVASRLGVMLRRRGVSAHDADEIVQETAARVVSRSVPYVDGDDLFRWVSVVGWRIAIDLRRRSSRLSEHEVPERADPVDVAVTAENRIVLAAVRRKVPELSARDQEVLLSTFDERAPLNRMESVRMAVARHRARSRLRALLEGLAAPILGLWARRCRSWSGQLEAAASAAVPVAACLVIAVGGLVATPAPARLHPAPMSPVAQVTPPDTVATRARVAPAASEPPPAPAGPRTRGDAGTTGQPPLARTIHVDEPAGEYTDLEVRPKTESDHLVCYVQPPAGLPTTCLDSPLPPLT